MKIGNKIIGDRPYVIAEAGVNHLNSLDRAKELIRAAAEAGCDAIKFQTYRADELVCRGTPKFWKSEGGDVEGNQHDAYAKLGGFPYEYYPTLVAYCQQHNIEFLSTPFSFEAADMLHSVGSRVIKIASSDMSHLPFLKHVASFGIPILLSTGASTLEEIKEAVATIREYHDDIILLHCTLCYPTKDEDANLNVIATLKKEFPDLPVGLSDHTLSKETSKYAVSAGAVVLEKHFTVDNTLGDSADHWLSMNPQTMKEYVEGAHQARLLLGSPAKRVLPCEKETRKLDKRSVVSSRFIEKGTRITEDLITYKRPGTGIWPKFVNQVIGSTANEDIPEDTPILWTMLRT